VLIVPLAHVRAPRSEAADHGQGAPTTPFLAFATEVILNRIAYHSSHGRVPAPGQSPERLELLRFQLDLHAFHTVMIAVRDITRSHHGLGTNQCVDVHM
jgi:hypothetical protein